MLEIPLGIKLCFLSTIHTTGHRPVKFHCLKLSLEKAKNIPESIRSKEHEREGKRKHNITDCVYQALGYLKAKMKGLNIIKKYKVNLVNMPK